MLLANHLMILDEPAALPVLTKVQSDGANPGSGTFTFDWTGGVPADGDLIILMVGTAQAKAQSLGDGFSVLATDSGFLYVYWKIASSEPSSYVVSIAGSFNAAAYAMCFRGYNPLNPVTAHQGVQTTVGLAAITVPLSSITVPQNSYAVAVDSHSTATISSYSNSFNQVAALTRLHVSERQYAITTTSQQTTFTYTTTPQHHGAFLTINPIIK